MTGDLPSYIIDYLEKLKDNKDTVQKLLDTCMTRGYEHLLCTLMDKCDVKMCDRDYENALCISAKNGCLSSVMLLSKKVSKKSISEAFVRAVNAGHLHIVKYLVEQGADISMYNNCALHISKFHNNTELYQYLMKHQKNTNANNGYLSHTATKHSNKGACLVLPSGKYYAY